MVVAQRIDVYNRGFVWIWDEGTRTLVKRPVGGK